MAGKPSDTIAEAPIEESSPSKRAVAIALLSLAGMGIAAYLVIIHFQGGQYFCGGLGDCSYVNSSSYAVIAGIPVALFGCLAYAGIFVATAVGERAEADWAYPTSSLAIFAISLAGVLFSAYLTYVELYILYTI